MEASKLLYTHKRHAGPIGGLPQVWWNAERTKKPQTFASDSQALPDSTDNGAKCDFCKWETLTAMDSFGRQVLHFANERGVQFSTPAHGCTIRVTKAITD